MNSKPFTREELVELRRFAEQDAPTRQGARDVLELLRMIEARDKVIAELHAKLDARDRWIEESSSFIEKALPYLRARREAIIARWSRGDS